MIPHKWMGRGEKPFLLIHGYAVNGGMFMPVEELWARHFRLLIPDLRGYGSAWQMPGPYTFAQRVQDLLELINHYKLSDFVVLGYSMGGLLAQALYRENPTGISHLILSATYAHKPQTALERLQKAFLPRILRTNLATFAATVLDNFIFPELISQDALTQEFLNWYKRTLRQNRPQVLLSDAEELFSFDNRLYLKKIQVPTLVISGERDLLVPPHHAKELAQNIPGAQWISYPNAGHGFIFTHRKFFAKNVVEFLKGIGPFKALPLRSRA
ncbi:MAG: alpha/beta fold hydrolase [Bacteroidia bacterium]